MFHKQNFYQIVKVIIFLNCFGNFQNKEMIEKKICQTGDYIDRVPSKSLELS